MLPDRELVQAIVDNSLSIEPFDPALVQPASIDVRLGDLFEVDLTPADEVIDPRMPRPTGSRRRIRDGESFALYPGEFALASTHEVIGLGPDLAARVEGKSSLGRLGLSIHATAGFIDPGFRGQVTLELTVAGNPIRLWPGMLIGQLCVFRLSSPAARPYGHPDLGSKYQDQRGPTGSRYSDNHTTNTKEMH